MQKDSEFCIDTKILIECKEEKEVQTIFKSLDPDNKEFPEGLEMELQTNRTQFLLKVGFRDKNGRKNNINTLINTIEEIMEHIAIIKEVTKID
jgi:tRNA threonylcarbamoyladenosine modification (KEOPS) complex  Pcc1 subunit